MNNIKRTEQPETDSSDPGNMSVQRLLRQKARDRAMPLRWNIYSIILSYSTLAAVVIMSLKDVNLLITSLIAVLGLGLVGLNSRLRIKKLEERFYQEEVSNYTKLTSDESSGESTVAGANNLVRSTESPLTSREIAVLEQIAKGKSNKEIADALVITSQTVKNHITHIFLKLDVGDRTSAVLIALRHGWIKDDPGRNLTVIK
jgi:DNA-binding NarL/FixJ family response regulator